MPADRRAPGSRRRRRPLAAVRPRRRRQLRGAGRRRQPTTSPSGRRRSVDDDPVFILYTGGTTGESKGALHCHRSVYIGMLNQTVAERIVPSDVYMLTGQMFHIPVVLAMNYMAHGCPNVLMNFDAKLALELIEAEHVSAFLGVTTMLNWMMAVENFSSYDISSLRNLQYGGGPMPSRVIQEALDTFPCTLIQGYGQTEGTTMTFLSQEDHIRARSATATTPSGCGRAGARASSPSLRVVDDEGRPVPTRRQDAGPDHRPVRRQHGRLLPAPRPHRPHAPRRLDVDRRRRHVGRGPLRVHRRPGQGHDHLRRREHLLGPGRGGDRQAHRPCSRPP